AASVDPAQRRPHDLDSRQALLEEGPERLPWSRRAGLAGHHDRGRDGGRHRVVHHRVREGGRAAPRIAESEPGAVQETPELRISRRWAAIAAYSFGSRPREASPTYQSAHSSGVSR